MPRGRTGTGALLAAETLRWPTVSGARRGSRPYPVDLRPRSSWKFRARCTVRSCCGSVLFCLLGPYWSTPWLNTRLRASWRDARALFFLLWHLLISPADRTDRETVWSPQTPPTRRAQESTSMRLLQRAPQRKHHGVLSTRSPKESEGSASRYPSSRQHLLGPRQDEAGRSYRAPAEFAGQSRAQYKCDHDTACSVARDRSS